MTLINKFKHKNNLILKDLHASINSA